MITSKDVLREFMSAWNAGERPRVEEHLARVPEAQRAELADAIFDFLAIAPTPELSDEAREAVRASPAVAYALASVSDPAGPLGLELQRLRAGAGRSVRETAREVLPEVGLPTAHEERTAEMLERLERGELDARRVSRRLLDALADVLGGARRRLAEAADLAAPRPAPAMQFRRDAGTSRGADWSVAGIAALSTAAATPAPDRLDEVERLFLGGRDA